MQQLGVDNAGDAIIEWNVGHIPVFCYTHFVSPIRCSFCLDLKRLLPKAGIFPSRLRPDNIVLTKNDFSNMKANNISIIYCIACQHRINYFTTSMINVNPTWKNWQCICCTYFTHLDFLESVEELDDVGGRAYVDEEQLGQLVMGELPLRQHPASDDENEQQHLLQDQHRLFRRHGQRDADF